MAEIKAADVAKLRKTTGAGMMDCKKALQETDGDFDAAVDVLRKKGQKVASKRADRETTEGAVIAKTSGDNKSGAIIVLNCETDFVAKNQDFVGFANTIADLQLEKKAANADDLKASSYQNGTLSEEIANQIGITGEKMDIPYVDIIEAEYVIAYIHPGNQLAALVGFNKADIEESVAKDIVMQVAAMNPVSLSESDVPQEVIDKELEIGKEQAIQEGKPADLAEKISKGKLNKFFKDSTLLNQQFIKDNKKTVKQYLQGIDKDLSIVAFKRFAMKD